jgi:hypothetical protein
METEVINAFGVAIHSSWVLVFVTAIYTGGTILLWNTTRKALDGTRDAFKLNFLMAVHEIRHSKDSNIPDNAPRMLSGFVTKRGRDEYLKLLQSTFPNEYRLLLSEDEPK